LLEGFLDYLYSNPPGGWTAPVLALVAFLETLFPPLPGDVLFIVLAGWAFSGGLPLTVAALSGVTGCFAASCILFYLGSRPGRRFMEGWLKRRIEPARVDRASEMVARHGPLILAGSRFVPGLRSLLVVAAGTSGLRFAAAALPIAFSAVAWYMILSIAGSVLGSNLESARGFIGRFEVWIWVFLAAGAVSTLLMRFLSRRRAT